MISRHMHACMHCGVRLTPRSFPEHRGGGNKTLLASLGLKGEKKEKRNRRLKRSNSEQVGRVTGTRVITQQKDVCLACSRPCVSQGPEPARDDS